MNRYEPDHAIPPGQHLMEFIERWQRSPEEAIAACSLTGITVDRAREMMNDEGKPWSLVEAADIGMMLGPSPGFWQRLVTFERERKGRRDT